MAQEELGEDQLRYMKDLYAQEYEAVLANMNNYIASSNTIARNMEFIEKLDWIKGKNMLLDLEAGTYIETRPGNVEKIFTYVGAGYMIEKSREDAKAFLAQNKKKTDDAVDKLNNDRERIEQQLVNIELKLNAIAQESGNEHV